MRIAALFFVVLGSLGCTPINTVPPASLPETSVTVDSRIELMGVIQLLSGYFLVSHLDSTYKREAAQYFETCIDHPAVLKFSKLSANGFNFNIVPETFISLSQTPELQPRFSLGTEVIESAGGEKSLSELFVLTREFAKECRFDEFFAAHQPAYQRLIAQSRPAVLTSTRSLMAYLGTPLGSTEVVLGPLLHDGGFAARFDDKGDKAIAFAFIGPSTVAEGVASFGDVARLLPLVAHEFAHTVVNPLTVHYATHIAATADNFEPLRDTMRREGYSSWEHVINESIIRALTARLTMAERGEEAANAEIAEEVKRGFVYVPALVDALREYEARRATFQKIGDFYPTLLRVFRQSPAALQPMERPTGA